MNLGGPSSNTSYIVNKELQFTKIFDQHRTLNQKQKFPTIMIKYPTQISASDLRRRHCCSSQPQNLRLFSSLPSPLKRIPNCEKRPSQPRIRSTHLASLSLRTCPSLSCCSLKRGRKRREELLGVKWVNGNSGCYPIGWRQVAPE